MAKRPNKGMQPRQQTIYNPEVAASHPVNDQKNAEKLIQYCKKRLELARAVRDQRAHKFEIVDKDVNSYHELSTDDLERWRNRQMGKKLQPTQTVVGFAKAQIEDFVTYAMSIIAPDSGMFEAIAEAAKQSVASAFAEDLNKGAQIFDYYGELKCFIEDAMKYNIAALHNDWDELRGGKFEDMPDGTTDIQEGVLWAGNRIKNLDMYNTLLDPHVDPVQISARGEFFATVELMANFNLKLEESEGKLFGVERVTVNDKLPLGNNSGGSFYHEHPRIRGNHEISYQGTKSNNQWLKILSMGNYSDVHSGAEVIRMWIRLVPKEFGLSDSTKLEVWQIVFANMEHVLNAEKQDNAHGLLPIVCSVPLAGTLQEQEKSYAERLTPLGVFANFLLNLHIQSSRKRLFGIVVYDPTIMPLNQIDDHLTGYVPCDPSGFKQNIANSFAVINDSPETAQTMNDLANALDLMQRVLPTDRLRQVTDLDRATQYQAAAVKEASAAKQWLIINIINNQAFIPLRHMLMYNTFQYREAMDMIDAQGQLIQINPKDYRAANLQFKVGDGLKGIDKLAFVGVMKDIINTVIQSQQAIQEIDIMALLSYFTTLLGDKTDLAQFKKKIPSLAEFLEQLAQSGDPQAKQIVQILAPMVQGIYQNATADRSQPTQLPNTLPSLSQPASNGGGGPLIATR